MFRQIAAHISPPNPGPPGLPTPIDRQLDFLFQQHPADLVSVLEAGWRNSFRSPKVRNRGPLRGIVDTPNPPPQTAWPTTLNGQLAVALTTMSRRPFVHDHIIYAYLIENTRVFEIFRKVLSLFLHGEQLGIPQRSETFEWLRTTEELFFRSGTPLTVLSIDSQLRPDLRATRRNAYQRLLGMDLNHGTDDGSVYPYEKAVAANRELVAVLEELLRQVWVGVAYTNVGVPVNGPLPIDTAAIANLALRLQNMLNERRGSAPTLPNLAREEFVAVAAMSWFHMTLLYNSPVVLDLQATAASPEDRLSRIGERVGMPPHSRSHSYFVLAPLLSQLLIEIEAGLYSSQVGARALFAPLTPAGAGNPIRSRLQDIIHHWSLATGRDLKSVAVTTTRGFAPPAPAPTAGAPAIAPTTSNSAALAPASVDASRTLSLQTLRV
ncbi:hypothetical protein GCM10023086_52740 [Streptomyces venetus]|uniref:Uncharacterized protein n=1 Tax=Streptomyces venetus TaxID=1701086 RepID=A0ABP8GJV4_9ACTN